MCDRHLLGEHVELHMLAASIRQGRSIEGYLHGLVEPARISARHADLVAEMTARGMNHRSLIETVSDAFYARPIDTEANLRELSRRCYRCAARIT